MKNALLTFSAIILLNGCKMNDTKITQMPYPETKKGTVSDNYFGQSIADPYRWLENDTTKERTSTSRLEC